MTFLGNGKRQLSPGSDSLDSKMGRGGINDPLEESPSNELFQQIKEIRQTSWVN